MIKILLEFRIYITLLDSKQVTTFVINLSQECFVTIVLRASAASSIFPKDMNVRMRSLRAAPLRNSWPFPGWPWVELKIRVVPFTAYLSHRETTLVGMSKGKVKQRRDIRSAAKGNSESLWNECSLESSLARENSFFYQTSFW